MKMEADYDPITGTVYLQYDAQAQQMFEEASKKLTPLFDFHSTPLQRMLGEESEEDIGKPLKLLSDFGSSSTRTFQVRPLGMQSLLGLICWQALRLIDSRESVKPFDDVLMLLSNVTLFAVLPVDLPPASEVFDQRKTHPAAWKSFERLRTWDKNTMPHLYAVEMLFLWQSLKRLRRPIDSLKTLAASLDASTCLLRMAFESLDIKEITKTSHGRKKK
jgi:hypothetical protein